MRCQRSGRGAAPPPRGPHPGLHRARIDQQHPDEGVHDRGVVVRARRAAQLGEGLGALAAALVDAVGRDRGVRVGDGHDAGLERDLVGGEAVRVAGPVPALVVVAHRGRRLAQAGQAGDQLLADRGVADHDAPLGVVERAGLGQDAVGDRDLADVVQQAAEAAAEDQRRRQPQLAGDRGGELGDLLAVQLRHALAHRGRQRERLRDADGLGLLGEQVLAGQVDGEAGLVPAAPFGGVERAIGGVDQRIGALRDADPARAADGDRQVQLAARRRDRLRPDGLADALADPAQRGVVGDVGHEHRELLAAPARRDAAGAEGALDALCDAREHDVADGMAVRVVDGLEAVDVEQQHGRRAAGVGGAAQLGHQLLGEVAAVREAGQRVRARADVGLPASRLQLDVGLVEAAHVGVQVGRRGALGGHVDVGADEADDVAVRTAHDAAAARDVAQ